MNHDEFFKSLCCNHPLKTDPDENGDAICLRCGAVIQIRFNMERFIKALRDIGLGQ